LVEQEGEAARLLVGDDAIDVVEGGPDLLDCVCHGGGMESDDD
jgi:hypothetical protein